MAIFFFNPEHEIMTESKSQNWLPIWKRHGRFINLLTKETRCTMLFRLDHCPVDAEAVQSQ